MWINYESSRVNPDDTDLIWISGNSDGQSITITRDDAMKLFADLADILDMAVTPLDW